MSLVSRIKELAKTQKITIAELERKVDLPNGTIRRWDASVPSITNLQKVATFFNVSLDYLAGRNRHSDVIEAIAAHINPDATAEELAEILAYIEERRKFYTQQAPVDLVPVAAEHDEVVAAFVAENPDFKYLVNETMSADEAVSAVKAFIEIYKQNNL
ncbi:helix-turn-helix transcriptional regulator [Listeria seeligeri]|uniref:helix-turn-helix domain-containing protein n=1 Tax=Listeria seeligeri TaxID=1640 RepID=UPI00164D084D|nr:helix-turn-helix transcriptional regulator [Listeria seeligeri]MBC6130547.1 helix-turn-helix transcriptional regulator [Listeria seeligeri]HAA6369439.1 XRE family transcriptional regulator [Listeria monocytogenes]HAA7190388.1 XRE family transcriptional regulator [Listeria monocytogenes]